MKITVLGSVCNDTIYHYGGQKTESFGGILYTIFALYYLGRGIVSRLKPVFDVGNDLSFKLHKTLWFLHPEEKQGIRSVNEPTNKVKLVYISECNRNEIMEHHILPFTFERIEPHLADSDALIINMISGFEIELETAIKIRKVFAGKIYLDIHSLALGITLSGERYYKPIQNWNEWLSIADIVQMNKEEYKALINIEKTPQNMIETAKVVLCGVKPKIMIITMGDKGSMVFSNIENTSEILSFFIEPMILKPFRDSTGCGDTYGAAFFFEFLLSGNILKSGSFASFVAGFKCSTAGLVQFPEYKIIKKMMQKNPDYYKTLRDY